MTAWQKWCTPSSLLQQFHQRLFGWGQRQRWQLDGQEVRGSLECIDIQGRLCVNSNGKQQCFAPGEVGWLGLEPLVNLQAAPNLASTAPAMCWNKASNGFCAIIFKNGFKSASHTTDARAPVDASPTFQVQVKSKWGPSPLKPQDIAVKGFRSPRQTDFHTPLNFEADFIRGPLKSFDLV